MWRASSAINPAKSEIFAHVLESYYCMPLPTYAFEWGADKGAKVCRGVRAQQKLRSSIRPSRKKNTVVLC